jgi:hypothetical protein
MNMASLKDMMEVWMGRVKRGEGYITPFRALWGIFNKGTVEMGRSDADQLQF